MKSQKLERRCAAPPVAFPFLLAAVLSVALPAISVRGAGDDSVQEWQEAAFNYESAAVAQETSAQVALKQAKILRKQNPDDGGKLRRAKIQAAQFEMRAADLLVAASGSLDHASRTWRQAALASGANSPGYAYFITASDATTAKATLLLRQAVAVYEEAAAAFAAEDELLSQAGANHKAAGVRERLAARR